MQGLAYPGASVSVLKDGAVIATTTADPGATFNVTLSNLAAATYSFSLYATDAAGAKSSPYSFSETLTNNVAITVNNIFLAPTIGVNLSTVKQGDPIDVFGTSIPNAQVNVYVHSTNEIITSAVAATSGAWFKQIDTSFLELGSHNAQSEAVSSSSKISTLSAAVGFTVGTEDVAPNATTSSCGRSDLNCDGKVNIADFSILLYFWGQKNPKNAKADISGDGVVNLTDLSLMLYDWTG